MIYRANSRTTRATFKKKLRGFFLRKKKMVGRLFNKEVEDRGTNALLRSCRAAAVILD